MKRTDPQLKLRVTQHLKEKVEAAAITSGRPLSHEIIRRLEWSFEAEEQGSVLQRLTALEERLDRLERHDDDDNAEETFDLMTARLHEATEENG